MALALREYVVSFLQEHNIMAPFSRLYRAMVLKMNQRKYQTRST